MQNVTLQFHSLPLTQHLQNVISKLTVFEQVLFKLKSFFCRKQVGKVRVLSEEDVCETRKFDIDEYQM